MPTPLYASGEKHTPDYANNPSLAPENRLDILPEHYFEIQAALNQKLMITKLSGCEFRLVLAVYHYTIGFNKLKDDMNGKRLEQITKIRYDHSNDTIVKLAQKNIIVTNKGRYGKWMSINFEFEHWSEEYEGLNSIDPTYLLAEAYQNKPIDGGDTCLASDHLKPLDHGVANPRLKPKTHTASGLKSAESDEPLNTRKYLEQMAKKLTENITKAVMERVAKQYPKETNPPETKPTETLVKPSAPKASTIEASEPVSVDQQEHRNNSMTALSDLIQPPEPTAEPTLLTDTLDFPRTVSPALRRDITPHLNNLKPEFHHKAQGLVYYFAECLTTSKVRRPIGFFISLKNQVTSGTLTLSERDVQSPEEREAIKELKAKESERQSVMIDYQIMKKRIQGYADDRECSFVTCLEEMNLVDFWQGLEEKLMAVGEAPDWVS